MKNILFLIAFFPVILFGQLRADQLPEITDPAGTDAFYSAERGSFQKITLARLQAFFESSELSSLIVSNDTIFAYTSAPDTLFVVIPDASATNEIQVFDVAELVGTDLLLSLSSDSEATKTINLSSLQDGTGIADSMLVIRDSLAAVRADIGTGGVETTIAISGFTPTVFIPLSRSGAVLSRADTSTLASFVITRVVNDTVVAISSQGVHETVLPDGLYYTPATVGAATTTVYEDNRQFLFEVINGYAYIDVQDVVVSSSIPTDDQTASEVPIVDAGGYYVATEVEAALQEEAVNRIAVDLLVGDLISLTGVPFSSTTLGTFVNPILLDNAAIKPVFEAFADSVSARLALDLDIDPSNELQTSETLPATPFGDITGATSQEQIEQVNAKIITDAYFGEVAYLLQSGNDTTAVIGNPFLPFSTINQISVDADSSFLIIKADQGSYANSPTYFQDDLSYISESGSTYSHYLSTNFAQPLVLGNFLMNVTTLNLDTLVRSRQFIDGNFNSIEVNAKTVNAITKGNILAYFILGLNSYTSTSNLLSFKTDNLNFYGCSFINGTNKNLNFEAKKVVFLEDTFSNSNRQTEVVVLNSSTGNTESVINVDVEYFLNDDADELKRGLLQLSGTVNDTLVNSTISLNCGYYESKKIATTRQAYTGISTSGNGNRFSSEQVMRGNFKNSKISFNYKRVEGSAMHQFYPLDNSNGDLINSTLEIKIGVANARNSILENWPTHVVDSNSTILLTCESCLITDDVAYRLNSTVSGKVFIKNSNITTVNTPVVYPRHDIYLEDVQFFNNGTFPLIDAPTPITVYLCNTNITRDRVGANVTLVYCDGQGEHQSETFTATAAQTDFTVSGAVLPPEGANLSVLFKAVGTNTFSELADDVYSVNTATGTVTLSGITMVADDQIKIKFFQ